MDGSSELNWSKFNDKLRVHELVKKFQNEFWLLVYQKNVSKHCNFLSVLLNQLLTLDWNWRSEWKDMWIRYDNFHCKYTNKLENRVAYGFSIRGLICHG